MAALGGDAAPSSTDHSLCDRSDALPDRLVYECGIPAEEVTTILNSVDLERFRPRPPLPATPRRALVFDNRAHEANILGIVREACAANGIVVEAMGYGSGNPSFSPESHLGDYDIIFAVGRAALEGLAVGAAVICCGLEGAGQMVATRNLGWLRRNKFGIRVLNRPLTADILSGEIRHYDPLDAMGVSQDVRATAGLGDMVDQILGVYNTTLNRWAESDQQDPAAESLAVSAYLKGISDRVDRAMAESNLARERAKVLQGELNTIRASLTWRLHQRVTRISFVRTLIAMLITPIRRWRARRRG